MATTARNRAIANENAQIEASQSRAIAAREENRRPRNALEAMAQRLNISAAGLKNTLSSTVFSACRSEEEFMALIVVANEYGLNPMLKEIYAFPAKGSGIVPMVSVDGWIRIMNEHPAFDGIEFEYTNGEDGNTEAIESIIYRKDRAHPIKTIEYMDECERNTDPWKKSPRRMLRHRALMQGARIAFGFSGIAAEGDDEEFGQVIDIAPQQPRALPSQAELTASQDDDAVAVDCETGEVERDERGMTQVDEETARALDAGEGQNDEVAPADETNAQDSEDEPAYAKWVRDIHDGIQRATTRPALKKVEDEYLKHAVSLPKEVADGIDLALTNRRRDFSQGED